MKIVLAKNSGFCFGVKRAINIALDAAKDNRDIITLGPIIHNPQMVKKLENEGVRSVDNPADIDNQPTIIRSHGVEKEVKKALIEKGIEVIDATCPYVSKAQQHVEALEEAGYKVVILGDENHPEVIAMRSYVKGEAIVVASAEDLPEKKINRVGIISQTTRKFEDLQKLVSALLPLCHEMRVINTICNATSVRQLSTIELAKKSDLMIVIGGKNSSNTKMLAKICENLVKTFHIETSYEIDKKWFMDDLNVGLTAGASTPDWIIVEVYNKINKCMGNNTDIVKNVEDIPGFKEE